MTDAQKRRAMLPNIKAATDCVARASLSHDSIVFSYRFNNIDAVVAEAWKQCVPQLQAIVVQHDDFHGPGTGIAFVTGPYRSDLPRAVLARIKAELDRRVAVQDQAESAERAAQAQREVERRENLDRLNRVARTLRDNLYRCTDEQLGKLLRSAETADVLATAAMTVCRKEMDDTFDAWVAVSKAEGTNGNEGAFREGLRKVTRDSVVTSAVQLKAVGTPSTPVPAPAAPAASATPDAANIQSCLSTMAKAREGKFVEQRKLLEAMLELCRPEIETAARAAFLATPDAELAKEREKALLRASSVAKELIGMRD